MAEDHYAQAERYSAPPQSYQAPLPAPTPQRYGAHQSMAAHLETGEQNQGAVHRGRQHQRSQSDMTSLNQRYSASPSYGGGMQYPGPNAQNVGGPYYNMNQVRAHEAPVQVQHYGSPQPRVQQAYGRADYRISGVEALRATPMGHVRHQSSPMVQPPFQDGRSPYAGRSPMHQLPSMGQMGEGCMGQSSMRNPSHVYETQQARNVFSARH